jgi:hypothetical protein
MRLAPSSLTDLVVIAKYAGIRFWSYTLLLLSVVVIAGAVVTASFV